MSNSYTLCSEIVAKDLTPEEKEWITYQTRRDLIELSDEGEETPEDFFLGQWKSANDHDGFQVVSSIERDHATGKEYWWLYHDESMDTEPAAALVQAFLKKFRQDEIVVLHWCDYSDKNYPGAFSGGAGVITVDEIYWQSADYWAEAKVAEIRQHRRNTERQELSRINTALVGAEAMTRNKNQYQIDEGKLVAARSSVTYQSTALDYIYRDMQLHGVHPAAIYESLHRISLVAPDLCETKPSEGGVQ